MTVPLDQLRVYHLLPKGASKANAVAFHRAARGYGRGETIACGDSREDLATASEVGTFWIMANALARDPGIVEAGQRYLNVRLAEGTYGTGVYEAVVTTLAERGAGAG
jgi:hydroxymethylpyrimidine pyrophosphatase-like HAD family hydrolase